MKLNACCDETGIEIRFHGRGGQGAVVASKILAVAAFFEGKFVQSFPTFGVERRGAPVAAFIRIDTKNILIRSAVYNPHHIVVLDPSLLDAIDVFSGMKSNGWVIVNAKSPEKTLDLQVSRKLTYNIAVVDATAIAVKNGIGTKTTPIVNTTILGAFSRATGLVQLDSIAKAMEKSFGKRAEANITAATEAYNSTACYPTDAISHTKQKVGV
ncbi:MAG: hypothetical protein A2W05_10420 [Candidatus Schekmanbacteria bacterium RBG_16_38_10]|uniref:Pyruvate/ketoisovalerate oxidoreductase catalytic domain-containing protein n=1 Tax=Candidatus Schekmanbacteria bacterium RBG_16_38_10 TaxID=1817879 RepID=A0A1F7RZB3_9BACT|nr:MAG: hypothetical protein A2W05_10420 [Candidatus Schekmanbacteria bacterium RBG_16_38_10]